MYNEHTYVCAYWYRITVLLCIVYCKNSISTLILPGKQKLTKKSKVQVQVERQTRKNKKTDYASDGNEQEAGSECDV